MADRQLFIYAEAEDLKSIFRKFEHHFDVFYVPTYSDSGEIYYHTVVDMEKLGISKNGSHIGNCQMLVFLKSAKCMWRSYRYKDENGQFRTRYSTLGAGNLGYVEVNLNGVYQKNCILPSRISVMGYENTSAKNLFDGIKKIIRKQSRKKVQSYFIGLCAYEHRDMYRFCTIDAESPREYDLIVD